MKTNWMGIAVLSVALLPALAFATASNTEDAQSKYAQACLKTGTEKLETQADTYGVKLDPSTQTVCGLDARFYNPSKYIWYCADGVDANGTAQQVSVLVQYSFGSCT